MCMWLPLVLVLAQAESVEAMPSNDPSEEGSDRPLTVQGGKPGLFTQPRASAGLLVGRVALGFLASGAGALPGGALLLSGALIAGSSSELGVPIAIVGGLVAVAGCLFFGALGASAFGKIADYLDALLVLSVVFGATGLVMLGLFGLLNLVTYVSETTAVIVLGVGLTTYFLTPVIVQLLKKPDGPEPTIAVATF